MHMLYDSDRFAVVHIATEATTAPQDAQSSEGPQMPRHGFEIVDKHSGKEVYLDGSWAELFQQKIDAWQTSHPTQDEVEDTLESYASLAQMPVVVH